MMSEMTIHSEVETCIRWAFYIAPELQEYHIYVFTRILLEQIGLYH